MSWICPSVICLKSFSLTQFLFSKCFSFTQKLLIKKTKNPAIFWMFDSKILLQAICGSSLDYPWQPEPANHTWDVAPLTMTWPLWEVSSTLSSSQITQDGESCLLSLLGACFSWPSLLCPWTHIIAQEMWDGDAFRAWQILLFKQKVPSSNLLQDKQLRFGAMSSSGAPGAWFHPSKQIQPFLEQKLGTGHSTGHPVPQEWLSSCQPENESRKMEKTLLGPREFLLWEEP